MRIGRTTLAGVAGLAAIAALAPAAWADVTVTQTASPDSVFPGGTATLQTTITNGPIAESDLRARVSLTRPGSQTKAKALYESFTPSQGTCSVSVSTGTVDCSFGAVAANAAVKLDASVQAKQSFEQTVVAYRCGSPVCDVQTTLGTVATTTEVNHPTVYSGTSKIKLTGLFQTCTNSAFTAKAKVKNGNTKISRMTASLSGPESEFGAPLPPSNQDGRLKKAKGRKLKVKVPGNRLDAGFYDLKIVAKRKGGKKLTRTAHFQVCGPSFGSPSRGSRRS